MNWSLFWDLTVSGVTLGSVYALVALGYSMVYGILKLLNFAHGDVYMIGAFMGWFALHWLGGPVAPNAAAWLVVVLMFLFAMVACGGLGVVIERLNDLAHGVSGRRGIAAESHEHRAAAVVRARRVDDRRPSGAEARIRIARDAYDL